jgi:hypothetical protein
VVDQRDRRSGCRRRDRREHRGRSLSLLDSTFNLVGSVAVTVESLVVDRWGCCSAGRAVGRDRREHRGLVDATGSLVVVSKIRRARIW